MADYAWSWELKRLTMRPYVEATWGVWDDVAQEDFFRHNFRSDLIQIIMVNGRDAGLLHVEREPAELFLANVQIHPAFQNRGLGTAVIKTVLESARALQISVRLQVLKVNRGALRIYERLGFVTFKETPTHFIMRWRERNEQRQI
jgi:ribosomal protein S18 acetylase RimI-like enzyme